MTTETAEFLSLADLRPSADATRMAFRIEMRDRDPIDLSCAIDEVPAIISYLVRAAILVRRSKGERDVEAETQSGLSISAAAIPASGAGFAAGNTSNEILLVMHLAPRLNLAFEIPHSLLQTVSARLSRTALTLSAANRSA
jgi:hypothetical protein